MSPPAPDRRGERAAQLAVRDARPADVPAIRRVARASWRAAYTELLDPAQIERVLRESYAAERLREQIASAAREDRSWFLVAERCDERPGSLAGYLSFVTDAARGAYLHRLYVAPGEAGRGVGTALVLALHERLGPGARYTLTVAPGNERARAFYARFGAEEAGRGEPPFDLRLRIVVRGAQAAPSSSTPPDT